MKIASIETIGLQGSIPHCLVKVTTDDGLVGWGEAEAPASIVKAIIEMPRRDDDCQGLAQALAGRDAADTAGAWAAMIRGMRRVGRDGVHLAAMAAVDIALWDLRGKAEGKPIHALLGGAKRDRVACYGTHTLGRDADETRAIARNLACTSGMHALKFGWFPRGQSADEDIALVRLLRDALGPDLKLMIDVGMSWTPDGAIERANRIADQDITWLEEMLPAYDLEGYARVRAASPIPITCGEMAQSEAELGRLIDHRCMDTLQIEVCRVGLTPAMAIAAKANAAGIRIVNHTYALTVNLAASLHMLAAVEDINLCEVPLGAGEVREAITPDPPRVADGMAVVPQGPGLGITIEEAALARFRVAL